MEKTPRVVRGRIELIVDHEGKELTFIHPSEGPNTYQHVGEDILKRELKLPTGDQTASLVYAVYNSQEPEFKDIQDIMKNRYLWVFNRNLWTPEGVFVVYDSKAIGITEELGQGELERRLNNREDVQGVKFSTDGTVRFAPKGSYNLGEHTKESLVENGFIIASFGKEGAKKLAEISTNFRDKPYVWGVETSKETVQRVSALGSDWGLDRRGLVVGGYDHGYDGGGCAFGVQKTGEASAEK